MKRLHLCLIPAALLLLVACRPVEQVASRLSAPTGTTSPTLPAPFPTATGLPAPGAPQVAILGDLQVDGRRNRLYAPAAVNGEPRLVVLDAAGGALIAAWDVTGSLALDPDRNRLAVDRGNLGLAVLDGASGAPLATVALPAQNAPPSPQADPRRGRFYAFRGATVYAIDAAVGNVIETLPVAVTRIVCDQPAGDAVIDRTAFDPDAGRLYLSFLSHTCVPWAGLTLVAIDTGAWAEIGRTEVEARSQFAPLDGALHGVTVSRLGPTLRWRWDGVERLDQPDDYGGEPDGVAVDSGRGLVYQAVGETIHVIDRDGAVTAQVAMPLLAGARLAGHDPASDLLYFVSPAGRLALWHATGLFGDASPPLAAPSPLPHAPVTALALSPHWAADGTIAALVDNSDCPVAGGRLFVLPGADAGWHPAPLRGDGTCDAITAVAFSPAYAGDSLLFAAAADPPSVLRSVDGGRSWTPSETDFPAGTTFRSLLVSPTYAADQLLFALAGNGELYRSRDGGRRWQLLDQRLDHLALLDAPGPALDLFGARHGRLFRSSLGDTWQVIGATPGSEALALLSPAPSDGPWPTLYAFTTGGRFARSLDGGTTWEDVMATSPGPAQLAAAAAFPLEQRPVFLLHEQAITASYDGMASVWAATPAESAGRYRPTAIAIPPDFAAAPFLFIGTVDGQVLRVGAGRD